MKFFAMQLLNNLGKAIYRAVTVIIIDVHLYPWFGDGEWAASSIIFDDLSIIVVDIAGVRR